MKSELRLAGPSIKIYLTFGFFLTVIVIFLALMFRFEVGLILLGLGGSILAIGAAAGLNAIGRVSHNAKMRRIERAKAQEELRIVKAQAARAELESYVLHFSKNERVIMADNAPVRMIEAVLDPPKIINGQAQALPAPPVNLLSALDGVKRCLIVGASDVGKTTLMKWLVWRKLQVSQVIVIDPHAAPGKWPAGALVVGRGRDYAGIDAKLQELLGQMDRRYTEIGNGTVAEGQHPALTILIDEWRAIVRALGDSASDAIKALLTESRKAAFGVFVATHSDRARPLGLEGEYDLKDGFAVVRLGLVDGQRTATIDTGSGEQPAALPGPFVGAPTLASDEPAALAGPALSEQEQQILELYDQGESISNIAAAVFGSKGGHQNQQVKDVLARCKGVTV